VQHYLLLDDEEDYQFKKNVFAVMFIFVIILGLVEQDFPGSDALLTPNYDMELGLVQK